MGGVSTAFPRCYVKVRLSLLSWRILEFEKSTSKDDHFVRNCSFATPGDLPLHLLLICMCKNKFMVRQEVVDNFYSK